MYFRRSLLATLLVFVAGLSAQSMDEGPASDEQAMAGDPAAAAMGGDDQQFFGEAGTQSIDASSVLLAQAGANQPTPMQPAQTTLRGFAETPWRSTFSEVKARLRALATAQNAVERVEILNEVRNDYILVRRNDIEYRYSFYKTPYEVKRIADHQLSMEQWDEEEAILFHVKVILPFIEASLINGKIEAIYGRRTNSTVDERTGMGAAIWSLDGGFVFQWYEPYRRRPFTRSIDFLSKELAEQIMAEYADYFDAREKSLLRDLLLR
ncbi:MAG: hypothetical protein K1X75_16115 [Leptospirales bacterium]|nr:hypothetical protein [Leptospirales bacterium]